MNGKEDFSITNILRIYDSHLIEKLNENYKAKRYESKNHFLNELIAIGLERKENLDGIKQKHEWKETLLGESIRVLSERIASLEMYTQNQFRHFYALNEVNHAVTSALYSLCIATNAGYSLSDQDINSGYYDTLPIRFELMKEEVLRRYKLL